MSFLNCLKLSIGVFLVVFGGLFVPPLNSVSAAKEITRKDVISDAKTLQTLLKRFHPNLYAHRSQAELNKIWKSSQDKLPKNPSILDSVVFFQQIMASVCDEHTQVNFTKRLFSLSKGKFLSETFYIRDDKIYFDRDENGELSSQVVQMNGKSSKEIIEFLRSVDGVDGCSRKKEFFTRHLGSIVPSNLLLKVFVGGERFTRVVLRPAHDRQILSVRNLVSLDGIYSDTYSVYARQWRLQSQGVDIEAGKIAKTYEAPERMGIWSTPDKSFYYIYITDFIGGAAQEKYMNEQMKKLVAAKPAKIVIDLASNPGGEIRMAQRFMSFLLNRGTRFASKLKIRTNRWRQPKNFIWISRERKKLLTRQYRALRKMPKRGRWRVGNLLKSTFGNRSHTPEIIVVVGPATRSAATMLAMTLKEFGGAKIVGRIGDISAKTSCTAVAGNHVLPRTKIQVAIPLVCFDRNVQKVSDEKALAPDYRIAGEVTNSNKLLMESLVQAFEPR